MMCGCGVQPMGIMTCCALPCAVMTVTTMNYWHWGGISATGRHKTAMPESRNYGRAKRFGSRPIATSRLRCFDHFVDVSKMVVRQRKTPKQFAPKCSTEGGRVG